MFTKKLIELRNRRARNGPRSTRKPARVQVVLSVNHNINDDLNSAVENIMGIMELGSSEQGYYISPLKSLAGTTSRYTLASHLRIFRGRQNVSRQASGVFMVAACFIFAGPIVAVNSVSWPKVVTSLSGVGSLMCGLVSVQTAGNHEIPDGWKIGVRVNHYILFVGFVFLYSEFFNRTKNGRQAFFEFVGKVTAAFFAHKWMSGFGCLTNTETSMVTSLDSFVWLDYLVLILMTTAIAYILVQQRVAGDAPMRPGPESEEPASEEPFPEEPAAESSVEEEVEVR
ncbi:hypothetical protein N0V82_004198 [Gnomoniopsis sp. IMI 355080]|nr:hypothetical protein N0V82_004198 [Gnomoniopsis sp. IMI 355080]